MEMEAHWKVKSRPALQSKLEELHMIGYEQATTEDIWKCVVKKRKRKKEEPKFYDLINDILTLKPVDYMNWLTTESYKADDWMASFEDKKNGN